MNKVEIKEWYERAKKKAQECNFCCACENCEDYMWANEAYIQEIDNSGPMFGPINEEHPERRKVSEFDDLFPPRPNDSGRY